MCGASGPLDQSAALSRVKYRSAHSRARSPSMRSRPNGASALVPYDCAPKRNPSIVVCSAGTSAGSSRIVSASWRRSSSSNAGNA